MSTDPKDPKDPNNKQITATTSTIDGFDGFTDEAVRGDDDDGRGSSVGIIQGTMIKFTNEAKWVTRDDKEMPAGLELIAVDVLRVVQKWVNQQPAGPPRILAPNEPIPDLEKVNAEAPKAEWGKDFNDKPRGPWQFQHIVYLLHFETMEKYTWPVGTVGGAICVRELADKVKMRRRIQGDRVCAVVTLGDKFMNTRFGGRQRPDLVVVKWVRFGGPQLSLPATPEPPKPIPGMTVVAEPTRKEEMKDEIPFNDDPVIGAAPKTVAATAPQPKSASAQKPMPNKRGVQKIGGGRSR